MNSVKKFLAEIGARGGRKSRRHQSGGLLLFPLGKPVFITANHGVAFISGSKPMAPIDPGDELGQMAEAFNGLFARLQTAFRQQRRNRFQIYT